MSKDLDKLIDKCIDRMNRGESVEDCLRSYPEHVKELGPLLRALSEARDASSSIPRATARLAARQRLDAALLKAEQRRQKTKRRTVPLFSWSRAWAVVPIVLLLALIGFGLYWGLTPGGAQANFAMLVSDEANAIGDFKSLEVTISSIGVLRVGESDSWEVIKFEPNIVVDLTQLQGLNAEQVWSGKLPDGQYVKVFIEIEDATGILNNGEIANINVPSGEMLISKPFALPADDSTVNFVCDITVVATGNGTNGVEYTLLPQVDQSGANQNFYKVGEGELTIHVVSGEVAPGGNVTIRVTSDGNTTVPDAWVYVNDEKIGQTGAEGTISFTVSGEEELEIKAVKGELEGELEIDLEQESEEHEGELTHLTLQVVSGEVAPGSNVTIRVTSDGNTAVPDAWVYVNDEKIGQTGADGTILFTLPQEEELEIKAVKGVSEGELEIDLGQESEEHEGELTHYPDRGEIAPGNNTAIDEGELEGQFGTIPS